MSQTLTLLLSQSIFNNSKRNSSAPCLCGKSAKGGEWNQNEEGRSKPAKLCVPLGDFISQACATASHQWEDETSGWIIHEYPRRLSVFLTRADVEIEGGGGGGGGSGGRGVCLFHIQSLLYIRRYYFCLLSLRPSSTFVSLCVRNLITHSSVPKGRCRVLHTVPLQLLSFFFLPVFKRPYRGCHHSSLLPPLPLFTRRSPALANKPLIFHSPLGTFRHYVPSARLHN